MAHSRRVIDVWMSRRRSSIVGRAFDIKQKEDREALINWLQQTMVELQSIEKELYPLEPAGEEK